MKIREECLHGEREMVRDQNSAFEGTRGFVKLLGIDEWTAHNCFCRLVCGLCSIERKDFLVKIFYEQVSRTDGAIWQPIYALHLLDSADDRMIGFFQCSGHSPTMMVVRSVDRRV